ncbi:hypothetical protein LCGC14_2843200 [marine sediment metagenome]|uniref:Uncharacterized protein n=1 Tax=marine sediment metagenome TaxID=412755 RepID=A0A0F9B1Q5_9ZZZZ
MKIDTGCLILDKVIRTIDSLILLILSEGEDGKAIRRD